MVVSLWRILLLGLLLYSKLTGWVIGLEKCMGYLRGFGKLSVGSRSYGARGGEGQGRSTP
jgi:hypothetical protein